MRLRALAGAAALAVTSVAASAAELPIKAPAYKYVPAPSYNNWAGFYAGVNVGYGWGDAPFNIVGDAATLADFSGLGIPTSLSGSSKGFLGGAQAGHNWQWNKFVYGLEGDIDFSTIKSSASLTTFGFYTQTAEQKLDLFSTVRARFGYVLSDSYLVYGTGGAAMAHAKQSYGLLLPGVNNYTGSTTKWLIGWTVGAGLEYQLARNWTIKGEYLYYNLGKVDSAFPVSPPVEIGTVQSSFKGSIVRLGLNYKF